MKVEITFLPEDKSILVPLGITVFDAARRAGIPIRSRCAGMAGCLMCKVKPLTEGGLSAPRDKERHKLGTLLDDGQRLSCQAKVTGKVSVEVPEDPLRAAIRRRLAQQGEEDTLW